MIHVFTESGSQFEIDPDKRLIRKPGGKPTARLGDSWKPYYQIMYGATEGPDFGCMMIVWPEGTELLPGSKPGDTPTTMTSKVLSIVSDQ